jgi:hypothetical protein
MAVIDLPGRLSRDRAVVTWTLDLRTSTILDSVWRVAAGRRCRLTVSYKFTTYVFKLKVYLGDTRIEPIPLSLKEKVG